MTLTELRAFVATKWPDIRIGPIGDVWVGDHLLANVGLDWPEHRIEQAINDELIAAVAALRAKADLLAGMVRA